ncbi:glycosyltransferase family 2 protein [Candidatus Roizmanbacteria bacterium]|nr:glycosyltransferase family 2 protein [Candidatus Roizmanbacteria bacterium]
MISLSIIIVSFNTRQVTSECLVSLKKNLKKYPLEYEVIVVDNGSTDNSVQMLNSMASQWNNLKVTLSKKNLGYGKGNNLGLERSKGKYVLYLNSDAIVSNIDFNDIINLFETQKDLGALTVKVVLLTGEIDPASHRGLPTLWRSFCYFLGLENFFRPVPYLNKIFGGYHLVNLNLKEIHEIEVPTGAFLFARKNLIDRIGGFDKDYFAYGEDIEIAYQIRKLGYKIIYYPLWKVLHLKSISGLKKSNQKIRKKTNFHFYDSMKIFYRKHYAKDHSLLINSLVYLAINLKSKFAK